MRLRATRNQLRPATAPTAMAGGAGAGGAAAAAAPTMIAGAWAVRTGAGTAAAATTAPAMVARARAVRTGADALDFGPANLQHNV